MQFIKVTNPAFVAYFAPDIEKMCLKINQPYLNYHSIIAYFQRTAQLGKNVAELWIAMEGDVILGFAHWSVRDIPFVGSVYMDFIYSKDKPSGGLVQGFLNKFREFGENNNSPFYMFDVRKNKSLIEYCKVSAEAFGFDLVEQPHIAFMARKRMGKANESNNEVQNQH